jgi:hypothetical protein
MSTTMYTLPPYSFKIQFNIIFQSTPKSSMWSLSFRFSNLNVILYNYLPWGNMSVRRITPELPFAMPVRLNSFRDTSLNIQHAKTNYNPRTMHLLPSHRSTERAQLVPMNNRLASELRASFRGTQFKTQRYINCPTSNRPNSFIWCPKVSVSKPQFTWLPPVKLTTR